LILLLLLRCRCRCRLSWHTAAVRSSSYQALGI
jgi:hypothetical protein